MLDSILMLAESESIFMTTQGMVLCCIASLVLGFAISFAYMHTTEKYSKNFVVTLVALPLLIQAVIMLVNGNLGTGVAIVGAFSLIRFRTVPGNSKEIGTVFLTMVVGLANGMGYVGFATLITAIVILTSLLLSKTKYGERKTAKKQLKITIPENLNYVGLFDDLFNDYLDSFSLERVKTTNLGSLFELTYSINLKDENKEKAMIDDIRVRNGNMPVVCGRVSSSSEEL